MSKLPRFPAEATAKGKDLNLIMAILDTGGVVNLTSVTSSGVSGDGLSPTVPNTTGSVSPLPGGFGAPITPRGFSGTYGIDNYAQAHTAFVVLSWTPNPVSVFVSRYDIYYHKGSDPTLYNLSVSGDVDSCRVNNLFPGNSYGFSIQAHDAANRTSSWTPEISINISADVDPPAIPTGLAATGTEKGVLLTWTEVGPEGLSNDLKQYQIAISTDAGVTYPTTMTVGPGNSALYSYTGNDLANLYFEIATVDWTGNVSAYSSPVNATVLGLSGVSGSVVTMTGTYVVLDSDYAILANSTGGAFTVTLPTPVGRTGRMFIVKRINAGGNNVTVATAAGNVDGAATSVLAAQWTTITVISDGSNWFITSKI